MKILVKSKSLPKVSLNHKNRRKPILSKKGYYQGQLLSVRGKVERRMTRSMSKLREKRALRRKCNLDSIFLYHSVPATTRSKSRAMSETQKKNEHIFEESNNQTIKMKAQKICPLTPLKNKKNLIKQEWKISLNSIKPKEKENNWGKDLTNKANWFYRDKLRPSKLINWEEAVKNITFHQKFKIYTFNSP